ncbi:hypothetical protein [Pedobacter sp. SL55]|uniref:hypothetical protein n=1 Tax=Pedobacter sp. SL55 TaxID=2995161 RepID=UPI002271FB2C|nr:hypothetical protein [Pedobacter sp. SL55]WAC40092.1 hypothetical protein OVA16_16120 [Pedobacter sp. SL55]
MKKIGQIFVVATLIIVASFIGCKKDENEEIIDVITSKTWKFGLTDLNTHTNPSGSNTYYAVLECEQDDTFTFKADGTLVRNFSTKKCEGDVGASKTVNYSYNKEIKELTIDGVKYSVVEENRSQLKYILTTPATSGVSNKIYLLH